MKKKRIADFVKAKGIKLLVVLACLAFLCVGSYLWDRNENEYDRKKDMALGFDPNRKFTSKDISKCEYLASSNSNIYHRPNCRCVQRIKKENLIGCSKESTAPLEALGYVPCKICNP